LAPFGLHGDSKSEVAAPLAAETSTRQAAVRVANQTGTAPESAPLASATGSVPNALETAMAQQGHPLVPLIEPLQDQQQLQALSRSLSNGVEEAHNPFADAADLGGSSAVVPRRGLPTNPSRRWLWIVAGALLHLTALALGVWLLWRLGVFGGSEPEPTPQEKPVRKKRAEGQPAQVNWATLGIRGSDTLHTGASARLERS
jgi:hypothetical protein